MTRLSIVLLATLIVLPDSKAPQVQVGRYWKLAAARVEPLSPTSLGDHTIYATIAGGANVRFEVSAVTFIDKVSQVAVNGDNIVIIGSGDGPEEAIGIDARSRSVVSRSVGRSMRILADRWLVSVEWYPNHLYPPQYPNDVVLIQDLKAGERECPSRPSEGPSGFLALIRAAGRPIYPAKNATDCSYNNVQNESDVVDRVYPRTFALTSDGRLLFLASTGTDRGVQLLSLVQIPLAPAVQDEYKIVQQNLTGLYDDLKLDKTEVLQVDHLEPVNRDAVRVVFSKGAYDTNQAVVPLQST